MLEIKQLDDLKQAINDYKKQSKSIAFVPTMGNLHAGHLSLIKTAKEQCDIVVSSIFVNPLQFGPDEDLDSYPRTLENDLKQLKEYQCDLVFLPSNETLLTDSTTTQVSIPIITEGLEADIRRGHLDGVATIVSKLFNLVRPDVACFGKKDYQQWLMIVKMVEDLNMDINIIGCETVREDDGLALSSRNQYLSPEERQLAPAFRQTLLKCVQEMSLSKPNLAIAHAKNKLQAMGFSIDYLELRKQHSLKPTNEAKQAVLIATVRLGNTRLLDNIEIN